jgi:MFS family permease
VLSGAEIALIAAALPIGLTGAWSPCGFSMVETIGPTGHTGGRRTTLAACASFAPGAVLGGAATFGSLAALGGLVHGAGGQASYIVAAALAALAAAAEARGVPIVPQVRRQLPEHWRRVMPMPLAAFLYGILLGLGFTTFVLSFGVWALAAISLALGDVTAGVLVGVAFGVGRALPIVLLAPLAGSRRGARATELMAERPALLRGFRLGDAVALLVAAVALALSSGGGSAEAADNIRDDAADPDVEGGDLVVELGNGSGLLLRGAQELSLPGGDPAIGGSRIAVISGSTIRILNRTTLAQLAQVNVAGVDALAVDNDWLAYRVPQGDGGDGLFARPLNASGVPGSEVEIETSNPTAALSRPSVDGDRLVYVLNGKHTSYLKRRNLETGNGVTLSTNRSVALSSPDLLGERLIFVRMGRNNDKLKIRNVSTTPDARTLYTRARVDGFLWTTGLGANFAYVTVLQDTGTDPTGKVLRVSR